MLNYLYEIVYYSYSLPLILVAVLIILGRYNKEQNLIVLLCLSSLSCEYLSNILVDQEINTSFIGHFDQAVSLMILVGIFHTSVFKVNAKWASFVILDIILLLLLSNSLNVGLYDSPVYGSLLVGITVICLVIYFFYELFRYEYLEELAVNPVFWIMSMYLLYFSGTLAYYALENQMVDGNISYDISLVNWILLIVCNLVFTLAIWLGRIQRV